MHKNTHREHLKLIIMSLFKYCECGNRFEAHRDSAKYCSVACSQSAYRERVLIKQEQEEYEAAQNALLEDQRILLEQKKAETDRLLAEQQAKQELIDQENRERELKSKLEREQKQEKQRKLKAEQHKKDMAATDLRLNLYVLGGIAVIGALSYLAETMQKQPEKHDIPPFTGKKDPESPA